MALSESLLARLRAVDTPSVCNAIEVAQGGRGFSAFTRGTMQCSDPGHGAIVGYAITASISAAEPPTEPAEVIRERRMEYYRRMAEGPRPAIAVIEDLDHPNAVGAFWGEVNTNVHKSLGVSGTLTSGVMRDLDCLAEGYPVIAGSIGPSHMFVHVRSVGEGARIFGMDVAEGALVHADRHGALVIPDDVLDTLEDAIEAMMRAESKVIEPAKAGPMGFAEFEKAWAAFEDERA